MVKFKNMSYSSLIRWRIRLLYLLLTFMLVYMVVVSELGGGDSRVMNNLAQNFSRLVFFGGMAYVISRIVHNKKLLQNRLLLKEQMLTEQDERNLYLHDKSGGIVLDILMACVLFITLIELDTLTASLFHMVVFYACLGILILAIILKAAAYYYYSHI